MVNTAELHFAAWSRVARDRGQPFSREDFARTFGRRNPEIIGMLFGPDLPEEAVAALGESKEEWFRQAAREQGVQLLPGVQPLVEALHAGGWRQAIGSSAPRENIQLLTELTGLAPFLTAITAMEDTQRGKPDPEVFLKAAGKLAVPPGWCVVMEDAVFGVQAAKNAGMRCIAVRGGGHSEFTALRDAGADLVVESLEEVAVEQVNRLVK